MLQVEEKASAKVLSQEQGYCTREIEGPAQLEQSELGAAWREGGRDGKPVQTKEVTI